MKVYLASSWSNPYFEGIAHGLEEKGIDVYNFQHQGAFNWHQIDRHWEGWSPFEYIRALEHPLAEAGYKSDFGALQECGVCILILPCNRSAHLELGYAIGQKKYTAVYIPNLEFKPELMHKMVGKILTSSTEIIPFIKECEVAEHTKVMESLRIGKLNDVLSS